MDELKFLNKMIRIAGSFLFSCLLILSCSSDDDNEEDKGSVEIVDEHKLTDAELVWEDNFEQTEVFDDKYWSKIPRGNPDWKNTMSDEDTLFEKRDGKLILKGLKNDFKPEDDSEYLTGGVYTKDKKSYGFGRWEIKAKVNAATGAWPAIWLMPQSDVQWPKGGEIDIMERLNYDDFVYQTVHSHYTEELNNADPEPSTTGEINTNDFNVYAVEVHPDKIEFFINEEKTLTYNDNGANDQFPFKDYKYYLLVDMQLGGNWVGEVDANDLPVEMEIDWVRFYSFEE